jgi:hypothetical protein
LTAIYPAGKLESASMFIDKGGRWGGVVTGGSSVACPPGS